MPKLKTHKGASKRFRKTKSGGFKHSTPGFRHLLTNKSRKRKRQRRLAKMLAPSELTKLRRLLPN